MGDGVGVTTDLAAWLLEQIQYDEDLARAAFADHNEDGPDWTEIWSGCVNLGVELVVTNDSGVSRHMVNWDPARVLVECDTKRKIVDLHTPEGRYVDCPTCTELDYRMHDGPLQWCETLRLLAAVYKHRDGYREEWGLP